MAYYNYETHIPRLFEKDKLKALIEKFGFKKRPYLISTLYFNEHATKAPRCLKSDPKNTKAGIYADGDLEKLKPEISQYQFLNWSENQWNDELREFLFELFPEKSRFES
jgi:hypothetical protein